MGLQIDLELPMLLMTIILILLQEIQPISSVNTEIIMKDNI